MLYYGYINFTRNSDVLTKDTMMNMYEPPLDPYCDPMEEWVHVDELGKYINAEDLIRKIIKNLYGDGDVLRFEDDFEELANIFDVKLPRKEIKLKGE